MKKKVEQSLYPSKKKLGSVHQSFEQFEANLNEAERVANDLENQIDEFLQNIVPASVSVPSQIEDSETVSTKPE